MERQYSCAQRVKADLYELAARYDREADVALRMHGNDRVCQLLGQVAQKLMGFADLVESEYRPEGESGQLFGRRADG